MSEYILEMKNITKIFPGVKALDNVNLQIRKGEIHALCGENGAGKSTLMKVLSGVYPYKTFTGDIVINGEVKQFHKISDSEKAGVAIIYQELALVKDVTVAENIFLGKLKSKAGIVNWNAVYAEAAKALKQVGVDIALNEVVRNLGVGQQQLVEIAKALALNADILILDEPSAALAENEIKILLEIMKQLRERGVTCILITHKLDEVFEVADRVTILRDGSTIKTLEAKDTCEDEIIKYMVGRELTQRYPQAERNPQQEMLRVENFNYLSEEGKFLVKDGGFSVRAGEVLGISGLMGAGRTEFITGIFGFYKGKVSGDIYVEGQKVNIKNSTDAIGCGMAMLSEDRKRYGNIHGQTIKNNITISSLRDVSKMGIMNDSKEFSSAQHYADEIGVKAPNVMTLIGQLSGGNQQKVLLSRCLMTKPKILFLDEPTRGIDVGAKYEIYVLMNKLAAQGTAIIMVSSELPEIIGMSDRVLVMQEGHVAGCLSEGEISQENIMRIASGGQ